MKRRRSGFTLIEVALFLAITGILFVGIAVGTQNSIFQQRFNDSVQSFAEYLRTAYSEVTNVRNESLGRSDQAIYGKLITFGENRDLAGHDIQAGSAIFSYNVIGDIREESANDALGALAYLNANVVIKEDGAYQPVGFADDYKPKWASAIQKHDSKDSFIGALLIVRHPDSGTIYTFVKDNDTIQVNDAIANGSEDSLINLLKSQLINGSFTLKAVDFCVNPNGLDEGGLRRDVRVVENARNGTGIEIIGDDADECGRMED
ncbi:prepilin-type N-terminal cleavage/methylation domain-containing protein [Candidatus Saccharibacteria bacterium]|nr:prepilin-type N-terminal cleavage/methylation domain-containing protein [Candidatus Saccharibacteria bacterium]